MTPALKLIVIGVKASYSMQGVKVARHGVAMLY
jgi:hypothetical protein